MKKRAYSFWKKIDMLLLESGVIPPGKSLNACKVFCCRHKIKFPGKATFKANRERLDQLEKKNGK